MSLLRRRAGPQPDQNQDGQWPGQQSTDYIGIGSANVVPPINLQDIGETNGLTSIP